MTPETAITTRLREDIVWRIKELSEIVRLCADAHGTRKEAALRSSVPVLYAHWEGYFVSATNAYLGFLADKRYNIGVLRDEFWVLMVRKRVKPQQLVGDINLSRFLLQLRGESDQSFKRGKFEKISGASNLNSNVLKFICESIALDYNAFSNHVEFIDKDLIEKRNHIAHGSSLKFEAQSVAIYRDKVVNLMRIVQNQIENSIVAESYKKSSAEISISTPASGQSTTAPDTAP